MREADTRAKLIDPAMLAAGWAEVEIERVRGPQRSNCSSRRDHTSIGRCRDICADTPPQQPREHTFEYQRSDDASRLHVAQARWGPGRPSSTTKLARVRTGAPGRWTVSTICRSVLQRRWSTSQRR